MILFKKANDLSQYLLKQKQQDKNIGFVPTMGALHDGHLSLIQHSKLKDSITVCSIFVNPTQFNNPEDFKHYPVTIETDLEKLLQVECDVLFLPSKEEIYPPGYITKHYELGDLEKVLEGFYRPGHFQGVCQVVEQLLLIVEPDNLYLGAKDFQQCKVITKLLTLMGKKDEITINIEPTLREKDGLAMSSRNLRLSPEQRKLAPSIYKALSFMKEHLYKLPDQLLEKEAAVFLTEKGFKLDYLQVTDTETLLPASEGSKEKIALAALYLDDIRLIDNLLLS